MRGFAVYSNFYLTASLENFIQYHTSVGFYRKQIIAIKCLTKLLSEH